MIVSGELSVNSEPASLGQQVEDSDVVAYRGRVLSLRKLDYLIINKPTGFVCSRRQQGDDPTIYELLPDEYSHLQIAGRLDRDSSGLMLLTNDGDYALKLTHPRFNKQKTYEVKIDKPLTDNHQQHIETGVELEDGTSKLKLKGQSKNWTVMMHEGRNRQIRRTFDALGYTVIELHRIALGPYSLDNLSTGAYAVVDKMDES